MCRTRARFLGGVEDNKAYPSRGQAVILHALWVQSGYVLEWTHIILRSGDVEVGGILDVDDPKHSGINLVGKL